MNQYKLTTSFDFSDIDLNEVAKVQNEINKIFEKVGKEFAEKYDEAVVRSIIIKAKEYDKSCNPVIVLEHEKHKMVQDFCKYLLNKIQNERLTKREIIEELKYYENY